MQLNIGLQIRRPPGKRNKPPQPPIKPPHLPRRPQRRNNIHKPQSRIFRPRQIPPAHLRRLALGIADVLVWLARLVEADGHQLAFGVDSDGCDYAHAAAAAYAGGFGGNIPLVFPENVLVPEVVPEGNGGPGVGDVVLGVGPEGLEGFVSDEGHYLWSISQSAVIWTNKFAFTIWAY